ncbi:MAG: chemotaxis protein CheW [Nitrospirota bacterium]
MYDEKKDMKGTNIGSDIIQVVTFKLGEEEFVIEILKVQEINRMTEITKVPKLPEFVEGVINLRGKIIPIIDIRKRFNMPKIDFTRYTRIIVVDLDVTVVGLIVDVVSEVLRLPLDNIEPPPLLESGVGPEYIRGVCKMDNRLLIFLDLSKVLNLQERMVLSER